MPLRREWSVISLRSPFSQVDVSPYIHPNSAPTSQTARQMSSGIGMPSRSLFARARASSLAREHFLETRTGRYGPDPAECFGKRLFVVRLRSKDGRIHRKSKIHCGWSPRETHRRRPGPLQELRDEPVAALPSERQQESPSKKRLRIGGRQAMGDPGWRREEAARASPWPPDLPCGDGGGGKVERDGENLRGWGIERRSGWCPGPVRNRRKAPWSANDRPDCHKHGHALPGGTVGEGRQPSRMRPPERPRARRPVLSLLSRWRDRPRTPPSPARGPVSADQRACCALFDHMRSSRGRSLPPVRSDVLRNAQDSVRVVSRQMICQPRTSATCAAGVHQGPPSPGKIAAVTSCNTSFVRVGTESPSCLFNLSGKFPEGASFLVVIDTHPVCCGAVQCITGTALQMTPPPEAGVIPQRWHRDVPSFSPSTCMAGAATGLYLGWIPASLHTFARFAISVLTSVVLLGRAAHRFGTLPCQAIAHLGHLQRFHHLSVQLVDDCTRRLCGRTGRILSIRKIPACPPRRRRDVGGPGGGALGAVTTRARRAPDLMCGRAEGMLPKSIST